MAEGPEHSRAMAGTSEELRARIDYRTNRLLAKTPGTLSSSQSADAKSSAKNFAARNDPRCSTDGRTLMYDVGSTNEVFSESGSHGAYDQFPHRKTS
jgi:hypothetical protein